MPCGLFLAAVAGPGRFASMSPMNCCDRGPGRYRSGSGKYVAASQRRNEDDAERAERSDDERQREQTRQPIRMLTGAGQKHHDQDGERHQGGRIREPAAA